MRVAHVAPTARSEISAAWRIRRAQQNAGIDAFALVHAGESNPYVSFFSEPNAVSPITANLRARLDNFPIRISNHRLEGLPWSSGWFGYRSSGRIAELAPDIVNLHWLTNGCVSLFDLRNLTCPVVLTLHDVWALTGGCHCNLGCDGWREGCRNCPQLGAGPFGIETAHYLWKMKRKRFRAIPNLAVVTPSRWLGKMVQESTFFSGRRVEVIPNCLNLEVFRPGSREGARDQLGLPQDKKIVTFGAVSATSINYKGFDLLVDALTYLRQHTNLQLHLLVFGAEGSSVQLPYPVTFLGNLETEERLAIAYCAADVFAAPSRQDNFPSTVIEAIACGIPPVAFDIGGIPEIAAHQERGYIAPSFDTAEFARGIAWLLEAEERRNSIGKNARAYAEAELSPRVCAQRYLRLYEDLLQNPSRGEKE